MSNGTQYPYEALPNHVVFCPICGAPGNYRDRDNTSSPSDKRIPRASFRCGTTLSDPVTDMWPKIGDFSWMHKRPSTTVAWGCRRIQEWKRLVARLEAA